MQSGLVRCGLVGYGLAGEDRYVQVRSSTVRFGLAGAVGLVLFGGVRCGVVR